MTVEMVRPQEAAFGGRRSDGAGRVVWKAVWCNIGSRPEAKKAVVRPRPPKGSRFTETVMTFTSDVARPARNP
jgi:hypothetical protein